jgi:hypothetical protein
MQTQQPAAPDPSPGPGPVTAFVQPLSIGLLIALAFVLTYLIALHKPQPHNLPVGVVASPGVVAQLQRLLSAQAGDAVALRPAAAVSAARHQVEHGQLVAAYLPSQGGRLLVAGGQGTAVTGIFAGVAGAQGTRLQVDDVVPLSAEDPRGFSGFYVIFGVTLAGFIFGQTSHLGLCHILCERAESRQTTAMRTRHLRLAPIPWSALASFCFPSNVIVLAVRWVQRFTPLLAEAARPCRHGVGDRWQVDETYVKVAGKWRYVYCAVDQFGQVIDVFVAVQNDASAARRFFQRAIGTRKGHAGRGRHRPRAGVPGGAGRAPTGGVASNRAGRQHPGRGPITADGSAAASDAGAQAGPQCQGRDRAGMAVCRLCDRATTSSRWRSQRGGGWRWR